ncbi:hypothetical protein AMTR_s00146p00041980 [Amborella trichopoda]|uniref:Uncharacterized protein n=1 Tax=Amborella trichopoda TaxID=13333 RepID=W1PA82_AMBTC|nr:hypothetical protein AMTR_s00146p00041980 [Amborella trichopoda]
MKEFALVSKEDISKHMHILATIERAKDFKVEERTKPSEGWFKLNFHVISKNLQGPAGRRGVICDYMGDVVFSSAVPFHPCTANETEIKALNGEILKVEEHHY